MVALSDLTLLAKTAAGRLKGIAGSTITVALATLAEGLQKAGGITIRANSASPTTVAVANTGGGTITLGVSGNISATGTIGVDGNATFAALVEGSSIESLSTIGAAGIVSSDVGFDINDGNDQGSFRVANLTADRTYTFPDASGTVALVGSASSIPVASNVAIHALPAPSAPIIYYCNDIVGASGGGVTGALVYYNTVTALWLRVSDDNPF